MGSRSPTLLEIPRSQCPKQTSKSFCPRGGAPRWLYPNTHQLLLGYRCVGWRSIDFLEFLTFPKPGQSRLYWLKRDLGKELEVLAVRSLGTSWMKYLCHWQHGKAWETQQFISRVFWGVPEASSFETSRGKAWQGILPIYSLVITIMTQWPERGRV